MSFSTLLLSFWGYSQETTTYILNRVPSKSIPKKPMEMWTGRKLNLSHIRIWGRLAYVLKHNLTSWMQNHNYVGLLDIQKVQGATIFTVNMA